MNKIEVAILNVDQISTIENFTVFSARLTQRGHKIHSIDDLMSLYKKCHSDEILASITSLPHPTVQKFGVITVAVVGASRRFLSQISRHQNEVKMMSASLQYSNYAGEAEFVVPYEILQGGASLQDLYMKSYTSDMSNYTELCKLGISQDSAGYVTPQGLRNVVLISATAFQWKHMIGQRICRRNTDEMRIVMLMIWEKLYDASPILFCPKQTGPACQRGGCKEGKMSCRNPISEALTPEQILRIDYPLLRRKTDEN